MYKYKIEEINIPQFGITGKSYRYKNIYIIWTFNKFLKQKRIYKKIGTGDFGPRIIIKYKV